ncbi:hypothetical protein FA15DRAFT_665723 [Coprinopsis marcescibilis]|uniref:Uncharacterized protein n=1 Tax=Coprinopsis marcescibilis TaxID=230819 RepID=A0A5C3L4M2_COPMA|nr:hypothetical protein FA15DRAFT_665723 [Coprinopsis marcescibilis]
MYGTMDPPPVPQAFTKPPLVTPSASPPPNRPFIPDQRRASGSIPPFQTQYRVSSTPKPGQSSSTRPTPDQKIDFDKERQASTLRLLDVWSQLAEKYTRRLDEDDIVDIVTGKVIKDNGILRNSRTLNFASNGHEKHGDGDDEAEEDEGVDDCGDADDDDELDAFADADEEDPILTIGGTLTVPPVTTHDPRDAADLQEFLRTEELRRDVIGSEPEDDPEEETFIPDDDGTDGYEETPGPELRSDMESTPADEDVVVNNEANLSRRDGAPSDRRFSARGAPGQGSDSEDELNFNLPDEVATSDDEIEIIEPPILRKPSSSKSRTVPSKSNGKKTRQVDSAKMQLQTPPLSRTSLQSTYSSTENFLTPPPHDAPTAANPSPEIPLAHSISQARFPTVSLDSPKTSSKSKGKDKSVDRSATSSKVLPKSTSVAPSSPMSTRKLIAEVVIERRTPFPSSMPSTQKRDKSVHPPASTHAKPKAKDAPTAKESDGSWKHSLGEDEHQDEIVVSPLRADVLQPRKPSGKAVNKAAQVSSSLTKPEHPADPLSYSSVSSSEDDDKDSAPVSPRKRKRSAAPPEIYTADYVHPRQPPKENMASSSKVQLQHLHDEISSVSEQTLRAKDARRTLQQRSPQKRRSMSRSRPHQSDEQSDSTMDSGSQQAYPYYYGHNPPPMHTSGPYPFPHAALYPPPPNAARPPVNRGFTPMPDPQTQYIVSQVMQHLSAMVTGQWNPGAMGHHTPPGPTPFTPSHHRMNPPEYAYSTPTHQHHPYPYPFRPEFSRATAPPETPEHELASSPSERSDTGYRKVLVNRSRSRGRRVSFQMERDDYRDKEGSEDEYEDSYSSPLKGKASSHHNPQDSRPSLASSKRRVSTPAPLPNRKGKGKAREDVADRESAEEDERPAIITLFSSDDELEERPPQSRGRSAARGQTPGPGNSDTQIKRVSTTTKKKKKKEKDKT